MKLNPDCVRDTLLYLEENLAINCKNNTFEYMTLDQLIKGMLEKYECVKKSL